MRKVVIASAVRTPVGSFGGAFKTLTSVDLGGIAAKEAMKRAKVTPDMVDEVLLGNVLQAGQGQNIARQISIGAGCPETVPALTVNKVCGSGLRTVSLAAQIILLGDADIILAGGTESMSNAPYLLPSNRWGARMGDGTVVDHMISEGLSDAFNKYHMGITAENVSEQFGITREMQDELAEQVKTELKKHKRKVVLMMKSYLLKLKIVREM